MNKKAVQWLYQQLPDLVQRGVLSEDAAQKLRVHYGEIKGVDRKWVVIVLCSIFGALLIGLGIILLLGHNWEQLSRPTRAVLSLLPLMAAQAFAVWVLLKRPTSQALREGAAIFLTLMVGASIALIGQTYNIPSDTPAFFLTWMLLILPLAYLMEATIPAVIYVVGISAWSGFFWNEQLKSMLFWPLLSAVIPYFVWLLFQAKQVVRACALAFVLALGVLWGTGWTLARGWPGAWILVYPSVFSLFYLLGSWDFKGVSASWQKPFRVLGGLGLVVMMFLFTFQFPWGFLMSAYYHTQAVSGWGLVVAFLLVASACVFSWQYVRRHDLVRASLGAVPLLALVGYTFGGTSAFIPMVMFNASLLVVSIVRMMTGIKNNNLGMVNTGMMMISALVLARFFDSHIGFVFKGFVFILIGICFLVANVFLLRRKGGAV